MALTDGNGGMDTTMLVSPAQGMNYGYPVIANGNGWGNNGFGGDGWWIILLLLLVGNNGWGGFGGWGGMGGFAADGAMLYPWMNQAEITTQGFQNQNLATQVSGINSSIQNLSTQVCNGFGDVQQSLCNGFAGVNATINGGFANAETAANARQMANMQQVFGLQTAMGQGFNGLSSQFADCCCENRLGTADLKYTLATEACATRTADTQNTQAVLNAINGGIQSIKDQLCNDKIDAKNDEIAQLRQEVLFARGQASQVAQNGQIVDAIYNRLDQCPVGTTPVYGRTPIFTCNNGCGCGCSGANF